MTERYEPGVIEPKWQKKWEESGAFAAEDFSKKKKSYLLFEFPYPSGDGLHVGHLRPYVGMDVLARKRRLQGANVLFPIGWDAFGLPTENYAIKNSIHPREATDKNIATFRTQMQAAGLSLDWSREIDTTDPSYYKWTQWIFLQLLKAGLAYQAEIAINWCPKDKIGLANEEVVAGKCERCGTAVTRKMQKQWMLKITAYADRLLKDLDTVDYLPQIKQQQVNWIGRSEGAEIEFDIASKGQQYVLLHGYTSSPEKHMFPWLKQELEKRGATVVVPTLPNPDDPIVADQVEAVLRQVKIDENSILIGHSLGGVVALKLLERLTKPVRQVILVCSYLENKFLNNESFETQAFDWKFDKKKIQKNLRNFLILRDTTDDIVPSTQAQRIQKTFGGTVIDFVASTPHTWGEKEPNVFRHCIDAVTVFTTRPDTLFGATYLVLAPEHSLVDLITTPEQHAAVEKYVHEAAAKSDLERTELAKEKTGVFTGAYAINPINKEKIPIWVADYVLASYGTGAIMAVPAHDQRDYEFAKKFKLPRIQVMNSSSVLHRTESLKENEIQIWTGNGTMMNSGEYDGLDNLVAGNNIVTELEKRGLGKPTVQFKLRDWVFSRQHYWGEPIPVVHCPKDGVVPIPEKELPLELPHVEKYQPTDTGESPLASITEWVNTTCPKCGGPAKRETDTMPNWAGSSWYFLRYADAHNDKALADKKKLKYWLPVDIYNGGNEHTTLHLLYSRFWHKFLFDKGFVPTSEPYTHRHSHGLILAEDGRKMSKSWGNVVNPDEIVAQYGADSLRLYEMFLGPFEEAIPWSTNGLVGVSRFLNKVWRLAEKVDDSAPSESLDRVAQQTIKKVTEDVEGFRFNTAVSQLMIFANALAETVAVPRTTFQTLLALLQPFAPHLSSELLEQLGVDPLKVHWPEFDQSKLIADSVDFIVQVAGKRRGSVTLSLDATQNEVLQAALDIEAVNKQLSGPPSKIIFIPGRLINLVP